MAARRSTSATPTPRSRAERQRETREALIFAALNAFSRDGYHAASLEGIAGEAGFSKGAVYSNFAGKAELFLAVMDFNIEMLRGDDWDPLATPESTAEPDDVIVDMVRGFGLATLEFVATAARDDALLDQLRTRIRLMIDAYATVAEARRSAEETLPVDDVARLMTALDQGWSLLVLSGITSMDGSLRSAGMRRLLDPSGAAHEPAPERGEATAELPEVELVRRLVRDSPDFRSQEG